MSDWLVAKIPNWPSTNFWKTIQQLFQCFIIWDRLKASLQFKLGTGNLTIQVDSDDDLAVNWPLSAKRNACATGNHHQRRTLPGTFSYRLTTTPDTSACLRSSLSFGCRRSSGHAARRRLCAPTRRWYISHSRTSALRHKCQLCNNVMKNRETYLLRRVCLLTGK